MSSADGKGRTAHVQTQRAPTRHLMVRSGAKHRVLTHPSRRRFAPPQDDAKLSMTPRKVPHPERAAGAPSEAQRCQSSATHNVTHSQAKTQSKRPAVALGLGFRQGDGRKCSAFPRSSRQRAGI